MTVVQLRAIEGAGRPMPPQSLMAEALPGFAPAIDLGLWAKRTFIDPRGSLTNPDHEHLQEASIGWLWTTFQNARKGRAVLGQAELGQPSSSAGKWAKARLETQLITWFGVVPHFLITLDAHYAERMSDVQFCALVEHELTHCAQATDEYGSPKFRSDGSPAWTLKGHDCEEFVSVVRRYGATSKALREMVEAVNRGPEIGAADIAGACGNCLGKAA